MIINVTQRHIDEGVPLTAMRCPLALALKEATGIADCGVGMFSLWVRGNFYAVPQKARIFRNHYDSGDTVYPFSFEIDIENQ